ncbi:hypothetical protein HDV05_008603 [Chytridiales sp. JEL 0842]|nr:hypothetical protein HDV05_008603 [Chytridiales sp. JEL 0842]
MNTSTTSTTSSSSQITKTAHISVLGMTCKSCVHAINTRLKDEPGISHVQVNLIQNDAIVAFDSSLVEDWQIVAWIDDLGFEASLISTMTNEEDHSDTSSSASTTVNSSRAITPTLPTTILFTIDRSINETTMETIKAALMGLPGVKNVVGNAPNRTVLIVYTGTSLNKDQFAAVIESCGSFKAIPSSSSSAPSTSSSTTSAAAASASPIPPTNPSESSTGIPLQHVEKRETPTINPNIPPQSVTLHLPFTSPRNLVSPRGLLPSPRNLASPKHLIASSPKTLSSPRQLTSSNSAIVNLSVQGMTCGSCVATIESSLRRTPGVLSCKVALMAERAEVEFDKSLLSEQKIADMIDDMGFEAAVLKEEVDGSVDLSIFGMTCASCSGTIEREVGKMPGMRSVSINLLGEQGHFVFDKTQVGIRDIVEKIEDLGFDALLIESGSNSQIESLNRTREIQEWRSAFWKSFAFGLPVFVISMILPESWVNLPLFRGLTLGPALMLLLTIPVQFGVGYRFYVAAFKALKHGSYTMDVLVVLGTTIAFVFSVVTLLITLITGTTQTPEVFFETCVSLISFITLGRYLENVAKGRTSAALSKLMTLTPAQAVLIKTDRATGTTTERSIPSEFIQPGDIIKVVPGERIAADGVVAYGKTNIDESLVTGESKPVNKKVGDAVIAGTVNGTGMFHFRATRVGTDTTLAQILKLVNEAQTSKAPIQDIADQVAGYFVPGVIVLGLVTFLFWVTVFSCTGFVPVNLKEGASWFYLALKIGISVIVVACPCALGLATPTAVMVGTGVGASHGILIKGGGPLSIASKLTKVIFDKTGTLTVGKMNVVRHTNYLIMTTGLSDETLLEYVGCAEQGSEHSIGKSLHDYCKRQLKNSQFKFTLESFDALPGLGVRCLLFSTSSELGGNAHQKKTVEILVGNQQLLESNGCPIPASHSHLHHLQESEGLTVVFVAVDRQLAGSFALADQLKPESLGTVQALKDLGLEICMITGDQERTAQVIGRACGISEVHAGVSPQGKKKLVERMQRAGHVVAMIGDGVNDSASIAQSDLGIAVFGGTDVAIDAASVVLMRDNMMQVVTAIDLCRTIYNRIRLNFVWATVYNILMIPLAMGFGLPWGIFLHPMLAGMAMSLSSVSVVLSSLLLKSYQPPHGYTHDDEGSGSDNDDEESGKMRKMKSLESEESLQISKANMPSDNVNITDSTFTIVSPQNTHTVNDDDSKNVKNKGFAVSADSDKNENLALSVDSIDQQGAGVIKWNAFTFPTIEWMFPLIMKGFKKPLMEEDLPLLGQDYRAETNSSWLSLMEASLAKCLTPHLLLPLIAISVLTIVKVTATISVSLMIEQLINYLSPDFDRSKLFIQNGLGIAFLLFGLQLAGTLTENVINSITSVVGVRIKGAIITAVYKKSLNLRANEFNAGKINTLIGSDANRIASFISTVNKLWSTPVQFVVCLYFIVSYLKLATLVSIAVFLAATFLAMAMMKGIGKHYGAYYGWLDERTQATREFLYGAKAVKYQSIESVIEKKIKDAREPQITALKSLAFIFMFEVGASILQNQLMFTLTFATYAAIGNSVDAAVVFPALSFLSTLIGVSGSITSIYQSFIQTGVSYKRLSSFFAAEETALDDTIARAPCSNPFAAVQLNAASFTWENATDEEQDGEGKKDKSGPFGLSNVTLEIPKGSLVAVVGRIGSGKSSLLSALAGSMRKTAGEATISGSLAYCPQQPWICSGTIEDNITLFDSSVSPAVSNALDLCSLTHDMKSFPLGTKTYIGEQGTNLSGGQKSRVGLARAIAHDADVYILDDPLAALDTHVGKQVFQRAVKGLVANGKTVILATHLLHLLPFVDSVVVMQDGGIVETGAFKELKSKEGGVLADILTDYKFDEEEESMDAAERKEVVVAEVEQSEEEGKEDEEDRTLGVVSAKTYFSFLRASGIHWTAILIIALIFNIGFGSIQQLTLSFWTDNYFGYTDLNKYLYMYLGFGLICTVAELMTLASALYMVIQAGRSLHDKALTGLLRAPMAFFDGQPIGRILNRMTNDVADFDTNTAVSLSVIFFSAGGLATVIVTIIFTAPWVSFVILFLALVTLVIFTFFKPSYRELKRLSAILKSPLSAHISETFSGLPTLEAYKSTAHPTFSIILLSKIDKANLATMLVSHAQYWFYLRLDVLGCFLTLAMGLLGVTGVMQSRFAGLAITLSIGFSEQLKSFLDAVAVIEGDMVAVERLNYYAESLPIEAPKVLSSDSNLKSWPSAGAITVSALRVTYPSRPDHDILKGLTFDVKAGEKIGVVGRTGAGKSTLMDSFFRLVEASGGSIQIDGQDISRVGLHKLRSSVAIIPQSPTLFTGTLRSNVDPFAAHSDDQIWDVLGKVGMKEYVAALPSKLDHGLTEGGDNLSAGQRQLIVLSKVLLDKCKVVVMDEATSSVDVESEGKLLSMILEGEEFKGVTVISVAHRLLTVAGLDRVVVLDDGKVVEFDQPRVLLEREGSVFGEMVKAMGAVGAGAVTAAANTNTGNKYVKNYEFDHTFEGQPCKVVMTCLLGHLFSLDFPKQYCNWNTVPVEQLFTAETISAVKEDMKDIKKNLLNEAKYAHALVIWTDNDREGEKIGADVMRLCQSANARLIVKRARFSVIQPREINQAWTNLGVIDMLQAAAVDVRMELDLRIGAAFSRFQTLGLRPHFHQFNEKSLISFGTCQFPTLGFVVDQFERVKSFISEPFWKIDVTATKDRMTTKFTWARHHLFDHQVAVALYERCVGNPQARVVSLRSKSTEKWHHFLFEYFNVDINSILQAAEKLYQKGYISYPRTETDVFDNNFNLRELIETQIPDRNWGNFANSLVNEGKFKFPRKGNHDDKAHPPIHPTKLGTADLNGEEAKIFEYVTRRFLACCAENAKGNETTVDIEIASERFTASGLVILERNYLEVYPYDRWNSTPIPNFVQGEQFVPTSIYLNQGSTSGPKLLTESDLISMMEKAGIGTDATIHDHIKTIQDREYANEENGHFYPTTLGMGLIVGYREMNNQLNLSKPYLRRQMEQSLKHICDGNRSKDEVLAENIEMYKEALRMASNQFDVLKNALSRTFAQDN